MWTYRQATGELLRDGALVAKGYAGRNVSKNNPNAQHVPNMGPLPRGFYTIAAEPCDHERCGPYCLRLSPDAENQMFGRSGFLIHSDSITDPGHASHGCIVLNKTVRSLIHASNDTRLEVVSGLPEVTT